MHPHRAVRGAAQRALATINRAVHVAPSVADRQREKAEALRAPPMPTHVYLWHGTCIISQHDTMSGASCRSQESEGGQPSASLVDKIGDAISGRQ
jgi:hypothetical protein